jgi:hypothetical protein
MKNMNERDIKTKRSKDGGRRLAVLATLLLLVGVATGAQLTKPGTGRLVLNSTVGFVPGQTLRVTVFNPRRLGQGGGGSGGSIKVAAPATAASGEPVAGTAEVEIAEGRFHSFDINRDDIALAGEPRTGRLQVLVEIVIEAASTPDGAESARARVDKLPHVTLELVDNDSGKTTAMLLPARNVVREAASR